MARKRSKKTDANAPSVDEQSLQEQDQRAADAVDPDEDEDGADFASDLENMYQSAADGADVDPDRSETSDAQAADDGSEPGAGEEGEAEEAPPSTGEAPEQPEAPAVPADQPAEQPQGTAAEQPAPQEPAQPSITAQQVLEEYQTWRTQAEDLLADKHYKLTDEQARELEDNPAVAIPRLAARLHIEVLQQATAAAMRLVPQLMHEHHQVMQQQSTREEEFFTEWPELREHKNDVLRTGAVYMQMNPNATFEDFRRDVGAQVVLAKRIDLSHRQEAQTQQAPAQGNGQAAPAAAPRPLAAGGSGAGAPRKSQNPFEQLDADFERFEEELE